MRRQKKYPTVRDRSTGRRVRQHRLLAAEFLGRPLRPGEVVHHRDGDSGNNSRENLVVLPSQRYHAHIEHVLRRERRGQPFLFPELLFGVRDVLTGTLFENVVGEGRFRPA